MIIACPACATRYTVPDSSIGADGRVVRCAKCRHSWFQDGPEVAEAAVEPPAAPPPPPEPASWPAIPEPSPVAWPDVAASPVNDATASAYADRPATRDFAGAPSSFAHEPPFGPRRSRWRGWLIAVIILLALAAAAFGAMAEFGAPDWLPLPHGGFVGTAPDLVLDFPAERQERRPLPNGSDFFNVSGSIRNVGQARRAVPTLMIVLRDGHNNIVYSLETASPKPVLAPGESETVNQAIIDAPSSARSAEIGWKPS